MQTDAYFSDPYVEYSLYPAQLPADLHGTSLTVTNVFSTDNKNEIVDYSCNADQIVHGLEYTFDCTTKNTFGNVQTINTTIVIKEPNNLLGEQAESCLSEYITSTDEMVNEYAYLSKLPKCKS